MMWGKLGEKLSREISKQSGLETDHEMRLQNQGHVTENAQHQSVGDSHGHEGGYGIEP
jgi:hypothetical protein